MLRSNRWLYFNGQEQNVRFETRGENVAEPSHCGVSRKQAQTPPQQRTVEKWYGKKRNHLMKTSVASSNSSAAATIEVNGYVITFAEPEKQLENYMA